MRSYKLILTFSAVATGVMVLLPWGCSKKILLNAIAHIY